MMLRAKAGSQMWEEREKLLLLDGTNLPKVFSRTVNLAIIYLIYFSEMFNKFGKQIL